jgi:hypothetical protein
MKLILSALILLLSSLTQAEIHQDSQPCSPPENVCLYWWPVLPAISGWVQDKTSSYRYSANTQIPVGSKFGSAETVIYAKASYKPKDSEFKTLHDFIRNDQDSFLKTDPALKITELETIATAADKELQRFSFTPTEKGDWEQVSYGEETDKNGRDYYVIFVISSHTQSGLKNNLSAYEKFINKYK